MKLIGFKPFWGMSHKERLLHIGPSRFWYAGEWFCFECDDEMREWFFDNFTAFSEDNLVRTRSTSSTGTMTVCPNSRSRSTAKG